MKPTEKSTISPSVSLGYVILYVKEVALVTSDVPALYARAVKAGATAVSEPATKPWGQTVAFVRDNVGHTVELCSPLP
jgi:uncharacterized glyoxalase superfamily protein PhnB